MTNPSGPQFVLGGYRDGTSTGGQGTYANYWSSSAYTSAAYAYLLNFYGTNSTVNPASNKYKRYGFSLRCLAQNQIRKNKAF